MPSADTPDHPKRCDTTRSDTASGTDAAIAKPDSGDNDNVMNATTNARPVTTCDRYRSECAIIPAATSVSKATAARSLSRIRADGTSCMANVVKYVPAQPPPIRPYA